MADLPLSGGNAPRNPDTTEGLDLFAAAWLERVHSFGGWVMATEDGKNLHSIGWPEDGAPSQFEDGLKVGAQRELMALARLVPGGREAIAAHVARFPNGFGHGLVSA